MSVVDDLPINYEADKEPPATMHLLTEQAGLPICGAEKLEIDITQRTIFCEDCHKVVSAVIRSGDGWVR